MWMKFSQGTRRDQGNVAGPQELEVTAGDKDRWTDAGETKVRVKS